MSGIAGIYYLDGRPVEKTDIQRMVDSIAHRGPDGCGVWTDGSVGLGHRMLWTTPESLHEKLPLTNKTRDLTITADARIDNRDELIPALNFNGRPRETIPDSEIILAAYEKWGEKCPEKLLGDFSFAIWDKRKQTIFCARDPIGIKPFYYYFKEGKFRWSSEPKAIFEDGAVPKEPNLQLICLYLLNRFDEREETLYKDVYRLPSSHFMVIENGHIRKHQYWDIDPNYSIRYKSDQEYAEHFLSLFEEAVKACLRSHAPVGALLSGGLDSSSIVCTAQKLYQEKSIPNNGFETFSIVFNKLSCDERFYIDEVVKKWQVRANFFNYEKNLSCLDFEEVQNYSDVGPFPTLLFLTPSLRDSQQKGSKVMLNGIGGDELLAAGYGHLTDLMLQGNIQKLIKQLLHDATISSYSTTGLFFKYCVRPLIPQSLKVVLKQLIRPLRGNGIPVQINVDSMRNILLDERPKVVALTKKFQTRSQQRIYEGLRYGWNITVALDMAEKFNAHFGVEIRCPFFDRRLIEFCIAVPEEQRWSVETSKTVLRNAMLNILPELVRNRKGKAEFSLPVDRELTERQGNKVKRVIQTSVLGELGLIHKNIFYHLFKAYQNGKATYSLKNALEVFVWLEFWFRSQLIS